MPIRTPDKGQNVQFGPRHLLRKTAGDIWNGTNVDPLLGMLDIIHIHLEKLSFANYVVMTGAVPDMELVWLYRNCNVNLYPSLFEGFGLPVLEGMQFGATSLASNISLIPKVAVNAAK